MVDMLHKKDIELLKKHKATKDFVKMLLSDSSYSIFMEENHLAKSQVFFRNNLYQLNPLFGRWYEKWKKVIIPKNINNILAEYDRLAKLMQQSELFPDAVYITNEKGIINGIVVNNSTLIGNSWSQFVKKENVRKIFENLPITRAKLLIPKTPKRETSKKILFFIEGFNNDVIEKAEEIL